MYNKNSCENTVNIFCSGTLVALKWNRKTLHEGKD
jgi:hypothetical protein